MGCEGFTDSDRVGVEYVDLLVVEHQRADVVGVAEKLECDKGSHPCGHR